MQSSAMAAARPRSAGCARSTRSWPAGSMAELVDVVSALVDSNPDIGLKKLVKLVKETHDSTVGTKAVREARDEAQGRAAAAASAAAEAAANAAAAEAAANAAARAEAQAAQAAQVHATLVQAPEGYMLRPKYSIPDAENCDHVRQVCSEGGDEHEVPSGDKICCECGEPKSSNTCFEFTKDSEFEHEPAEDPAALKTEGSCCADPTCLICKANEMHCCALADCDMCKDKMMKKSHGVNPDYWEEMAQDEAYEPGNLEQQFPDDWCEALSEDHLLLMYQRCYALTPAEPFKSGVMGLIPSKAEAIGDRICMEMMAASRGAGMHDPQRLGPLVQQVQKIEADVIMEGAWGAFDDMVGLLSAVDDARGDSGWTYVDSHTGPIVEDLSRLMLTALASVVLSIAHQNPEGSDSGTGPLVGTPAWVAVRTAVDMMGNIDPMLGDSCDDIRARIKTYGDFLEAAGEAAAGATEGGGAAAPADDDSAAAIPQCGLSEFRGALRTFILAHGSALF